jgi:small-conductance mechanosensitive channel
MKKQPRKRTIIVRGVAFQVTPEQAREIEKREREIVRKEWNTNQIID